MSQQSHYGHNNLSNAWKSLKKGGIYIGTEIDISI